MQVSAGGRDRPVPERRLDQMNRSAVVECVGSVRVTEPVGADGFRNSGSLRCILEYDPHPTAIKRLSCSGRKDGLVGGGPGAEFEQFVPQLVRDGDCPRPAVLPEHGDLGFVGVVLQIPPF
jgi:hypothetical protein